MLKSSEQVNEFAARHVGPDAADIRDMLRFLDSSSLDQLVDQTLPKAIRLTKPLNLPPGVTEYELLQELRALAKKNQVFKSYLGTGYSGCITPPVIQRNVLESPAWYTAYTPYQAEIAQGRLEALLNFQTMVIDLTALEVANASLLDESTAAAEAMTMMWNVQGRDNTHEFFVARDCHPQTIEVVRTRAEPLKIRVTLVDAADPDFERRPFGILLQYPNTFGAIQDYASICAKAREAGTKVIVAADLLALTLLTPPGEFGADVAVGNTQRFGVPLGYGGPHAAYLATRSQLTRYMPGRIIGASQDAQGATALRMALQTREQHIRREKATSNICTAQVLLAVVSSMYAVYHGPQGLRRIAIDIHVRARQLGAALKQLGFQLRCPHYFDTICVEVKDGQAANIASMAERQGINLRVIGEDGLCIALDETTLGPDVDNLVSLFADFRRKSPPPLESEETHSELSWPSSFRRQSGYLAHPVFNTHHSETEMLRYIHQLQSRDLSLCHSMIPLGSCTMKLNATAEMMPVTWPEFGQIHPFAPTKQTEGYQELFKRLEGALAEITGFDGVSLQPNAGSQGELAGLLVIRKYHASRGQDQRDVCLIPSSAHGTNPASAAMAGYEVVVVKCDDDGNVDLADLRAKAHEYRDRLAVLMVTYPSTHGVFEHDIKDICGVIHECGGQVYMDGANMNAQVGLCRPGDIGADVCHLNLHKTFCIPHGGGGPGMGPIAVASHLTQFLPRHPFTKTGGPDGVEAISAAPWGSASILPISWAYIRMMGGQGLAHATKVAILNANYMARRLDPHFPVLYRGENGRVAHECIVDLRSFKKTGGVEVEDVAKRLMDYGFHAPTVSFPVAGTMMIEPTESESKAELDRFCDAMISIRQEIREIESGTMPRENNLLKNAPHTVEVIAFDQWTRPYSRERAAFPAPWTRRGKFWPSVGRVNGVLGDRHLICTCLPPEAYERKASANV